MYIKHSFQSAEGKRQTEKGGGSQTNKRGKIPLHRLYLAAPAGARLSALAHALYVAVAPDAFQANKPMIVYPAQDKSMLPLVRAPTSYIRSHI